MKHNKCKTIAMYKIYSILWLNICTREHKSVITTLIQNGDVLFECLMN